MLGASVNDEREVAFPKGRQRELNSRAAVFITRRLVTRFLERAFDRRFDLRAVDGLAIRAAPNFDFQRDLSAGKPGSWIQQLGLDSGNLGFLFGGSSNFSVQSAGTKLFDNSAMLFGNAML